MAPWENIPIKTHIPELVEKSLAQEKSEVFSATSEQRLKLMREIFNGISSETPVRVIRNATDQKKDVLLRDSSMHAIDYLGSGDTVTLVSDKNITGNTNGYSYIHRRVKIDGVDVNKIYVKSKTGAGQIGYVALEHIGKEASKPTSTPSQAQKSETKPAPKPTSTPSQAQKSETKPAPKPTSTPSQAQKSETKPAPKPTSTPSQAQKSETKPAETKPAPKPVAEVSKEDPKAITTVTSLPSGLMVARGPKQSTHPLISQGKMADMVLIYEWPGGKRQPDAWNTYDIGWGINTGGPELERRYALGDNYSNWNDTFIPVDEVKNAVNKTLEARIARAYESCRKHEIDFDGLPLFAQKVVVDLHYNMTSIQNDFPKFWKAIKEKNWKEAGKQLMDSGGEYPSGYLKDVYTRAYANAMMLTHEDPDGAQKYKDETTGIIKDTHNAQLLYDAYFGKTGKYGDHLGWWEKRKLSKETTDPVEFADILLSDDVLRADKKSTATIQSLIQKHLRNNPGNRDTLVAEFKKRFGGFNWPLDTGTKIAAYQIYIYLTHPERFKKDVVYIDGQYGQKTKNNFLDDTFHEWTWEEKIESSSGILRKSPTEIKEFISKLGIFEKTLLKYHYQKYLNISNNASESDIMKAQFVLSLFGNQLDIDGKLSKNMEELLWYSKRAKALAQFVQDNYASYDSGSNSCWASVGKMLAAFGIWWVPSSGRNGENWNEFLDALSPEQFIKIPIDDPSQARPGGILCYEDGGSGGAAVKWGHVEVKWTDGAYYHYLRSTQWWGSRGQDVENSHFTGYVYYPRDMV
jgi:hypothetical protein